MYEIGAGKTVCDFVDFCDGKDSTTRFIESQIDWHDSGAAEAA